MTPIMKLYRKTPCVKLKILVHFDSVLGVSDPYPMFVLALES